MRTRRDKSAFINITHSFIIYYCVLLSVRSDTFLNTLGNQRCVSAAKKLKESAAASSCKKLKLQCVECEARRKGKAENFNNDQQKATLLNQQDEKLDWNYLAAARRLCIFKYPHLISRIHRRAAQDINFRSEKWAVRATNRHPELEISWLACTCILFTCIYIFWSVFKTEGKSRCATRQAQFAGVRARTYPKQFIYDFNFICRLLVCY